MMKRKLGVFTLTLIGALTLAALAGILPAGTSPLTGVTGIEASIHEPQLHSGDSVSNQQAGSGAIAAHGADKWHEAGFKGAGVKIGIIDFGFGGIESHIGTEVPDPVGVRCYSFNLNPSAPPSYTTDIADCDHTALHFSSLHGSSVLEAVYDIAPEAEYYIAAVSHFSFYHTDLKDAVDWMIDEDVDIITFSHAGGWSGPGDGTSVYPTSEINTLNNAVGNGITWISPAGDRARDTWSGFFTDTDSDDIHEFDPGIECNDVDLSETDHPYRVQLRWADTWRAATRDFELSLVDKSNGQVVATSQKNAFAPGDPNELLDFTTPDRQASYCLRLQLMTPTDEQIIVNMQSYGRHGLSYPSLFGSITSPGESNNDGALTVGAAPVGNPDQVQPFSGRGPMNSGDIKPDIVGVDDTHSAILGGTWESTSLAAAHVTGLAALVKQRYPDYTPAMIAEYLRENAESRLDSADPFGRVDPNNTWGHGFAMLPASDVEGVTPSVPLPDDPKAAAKAFVEEAIAAYRADSEAAKTYYQSEASVDRNTDLYLFIIDGTEIIVNGGFAGAVGEDITSRIGIDAIGKEYGREIAAADENGTFVDYLIPDPLHNFTLYRKHTWAVKADGLVFAAGSWDKTEDVESTLQPHQAVVAFIYKAGARLLAFGGDLSALGRIIAYYNTPGSIEGERYVFLVAPNGQIAADATRLDLLGSNITDLQASDDPALGRKIAAVQEGESLWFSHMWPNPATGQEERKYTYVTRFQGMIFGSGYYGGAPPPDLQDPCFTPIGGSGTHTGSWDDTCLSANRPEGEGGNPGSDYYARFFTFTLDESTSVTINLTSEEDTFLYLMEGSENDGDIEGENDDISTDNRNSQIEGHALSAGTYTIEATTYSAERTGEFTLVVEIEEVDEPTVPDAKYIAISSGANHVCAIAEDGSIMCWGDNDYGQVSDRPTSGSFTQISSGDNHTCALRNDGAVICWGSIDVP